MADCVCNQVNLGFSFSYTSPSTDTNIMFGKKTLIINNNTVTKLASILLRKSNEPTSICEKMLVAINPSY